MLIFFDESFRKSKSMSNKSLGILCGIGIPEEQLYSVVADVYQIKYKNLGADFAKNDEIKGKELFKNYVFALEAKGIKSKHLALGGDLVDYIVSKKLPIFGCVCFEDGLQLFKCGDVSFLDKTFFYIFERIDIYLKREYPQKMAKLIFDDREYSINKSNAEAITNFFVRSPIGLAMDNIIKTPFFAISQAQNVGLQLADFVTTIIGLKFARSTNIEPYWQRLRSGIYTWKKDGLYRQTTLKILRSTK